MKGFRFFFILSVFFLLPCCARGYDYPASYNYRISSSTSASRNTEKNNDEDSTKNPEEIFGKAIADLSPTACLQFLAQNQIEFRELSNTDAPNVETPGFLESKIQGISFDSIGNQKNKIMDCRTVAALWFWSSFLKKRGVMRVNYFSVYRPGARVQGTKKISGHSRALAFDLKSLVLSCSRLGENCDSEHVLVDVLTDWGDRTREVDPCDVKGDSNAKAQLLRDLVCDVVESELFQVVLTPHKDKAHQNHVHLELKTNTDWTYIR